MNSIIQKLWMFIAALCASLSASAWDFKSDGLRYSILSEKDRTVEVTYLRKSYDNNSYVSGNIEIPQKVIHNSKTYTVTSIGELAFYECSRLISVTIPNSVTSIGNDAFFRCSSLTSVTIPNSITYIGESAFYCCDLTSVTIPNSVTYIGESAFYCCDMTSVTIPNSVTYIGKSAFELCRSLTSVTIPNSVTSIRESTFRGCGLKSLTIPNSVTLIGNAAFEYCENLTYVTIPKFVISIGETTFRGCSRLDNINVDPENATYSSIDGILYNKDATSFITCPGARKVMTIPNSVTTIGNYAFNGCLSLTSVTIPNSVTTIEYYAFNDCNNLKTIYLQCEVPIKCNPGFSDNSLKETILYIPVGTKAEYEKVDPWRNFWNIEEMDFSGIDGIEADEYGTPNISVNNGILTIDGIGSHESVTVYDMEGRIFYNGTSHTIDILTPGLYIVKAGSRSIKISI